MSLLGYTVEWCLLLEQLTIFLKEIMGRLQDVRCCVASCGGCFRPTFGREPTTQLTKTAFGCALAMVATASCALKVAVLICG